MAGSSTDGTPEGVPYEIARVPDETARVAYATRRTLEIWTAAAVGLVGVVVIVESLTHDIGWNETGPGSGYFPFRVGLLLIAAAIVRVAQSIRSRRDGAASNPETLASGPAEMHASGAAVFVTREELQRSVSVFWPTLALVVAMFPLGCYVPSAVYLAWMMRVHGGYGWPRSAAFGVAAVVAFFLVFDIWFQVPLAKGPVEAAFGIY